MTRMLVSGPRLASYPAIEDIDVRPTSLRRQSHISVGEE
jgi:hypothetical protein